MIGTGTTTMVRLPKNVFELLMLKMKYSEMIKYCQTYTKVQSLCNDRKFLIKYIWHNLGFEFNMDRFSLTRLKDMASLTDILDIYIYETEEEILSAHHLDRFFRDKSKFQREVMKIMLKSGKYPSHLSNEMEKIFALYDDADEDTVVDIVDDMYERFADNNLLSNYIKDVFTSYYEIEGTMDIYEFLRTENSTVFSGLLEFAMDLLEFFGNRDEIIPEEEMRHMLKIHINTTWITLERSLVREAEYADFVEILDLHVDIFGGVDIYAAATDEERYRFDDNINRLLSKFEAIMNKDEYNIQMNNYYDRLQDIFSQE